MQMLQWEVGFGSILVLGSLLCNQFIYIVKYEHCKLIRAYEVCDGKICVVL